MKRARPLRPAAAKKRGPAPFALRLVIASMPLFPSLAQADATVPGQGPNKGQEQQKPEPAKPILEPPPVLGGAPPPVTPPKKQRKGA